MEIQPQQISLTDRLQYLDSISTNQAANTVKTPWSIIAGCTIGGILIGLLIRSAINSSKKEKAG